MVRINPVNKIGKSQFIIVKKLIESRGRGTSELEKKKVLKVQILDMLYLLIRKLRL